MKVIGKGQHAREYLAIVQHEELEKCADKYYGKLEALKVGDEFNIGEGYDFSSRIQEACRKMTEAMKAFDEAKKTLTDFALMVGKLPEQSKEE